MMVRFATLCDICHKRSEEFTSWPSCESCGSDVCPACTSRVTREADEGRLAEVECCECAGLFRGTDECVSDCWDQGRHSVLCQHAPVP